MAVNGRAALPVEPSLLSAMWRHRVVVLLAVVIAVAAATLYGVTRPRSYVGEASLILQPQSGSVAQGAPEAARYVTDQLTVLRSRAVIERALATTRAALPRAEVTEDDFRHATFVSSADSDVIGIRFRAPGKVLAATGANAIGRSYESALQAEVAATAAQSAKANADKIDAIDTRLGQIADELGALPSTPQNDARVTSLTAEQSSLLGQRATLFQQRGALGASSAAPGATALFIPVDTVAAPSTSSLPRLLVVAAFLGLLAGAAIAYVLALRRRTFSSAAEIESIVRAPMLAEIPDFSNAPVTPMPGLRPSGTAAGEVFRVAASAIASRAEQTGATVLLVVSANPADGKSAVTANVAVAAATDGARVLAVDADARNRTLSGLIESAALDRALLDAPMARTDAVADPAGRGIRPIRVFTATATLDVLLTGMSPSSNAWRSDAMRKYFHDAREAYDLVLIDTPGLLASSEAAALAVHADAAVVVVAAGSDVADVSAVVTTLHLVGTEILGFVHNLRPLRTRGTRRSTASVGASEVAGAQGWART